MALLEFACIPKSTYYYYVKSLSRPDKYFELKKKIQEIFDEHHQCYGYRRITLELKNKGIITNHKLVLRLMNELNLKCKIRRKRYKSYKGDVGKIAPNIIDRNFGAKEPNAKWTTDVSEFSIQAGRLYLSPILDMFNGEIISFNIGKSPNLQQTMLMLDEALHQNLDLNSLILHSDQGWQYQNGVYQRMLKAAGVTQSMSRKGNCLDNAVIESFFGIMKAEMFDGYKFETLEKLEIAIRDYIDYYNNKRIKLRLNGMSPVKYREKFQKNAPDRDNNV